MITTNGMMKNRKTFVARAIAALVCLFAGGTLQIVFWKTPDRTYLEALTQHSYLWIVYLLLGLLAGEHCHRLFKHK